MNLSEQLERVTISAHAFEIFVSDQLRFLKAMMKEKPKSLMPHVIVQTMDLEGKTGLVVSAIAMNFNEDEEKRAILMDIGRTVFEQQVVPQAVAILAEAWASKSPRESRVEPRYADNRREIVMLGARNLTNELTKLASFPVLRDSEGRMEAVDQLEIGPGRMRLLDHFYRGYFDIMKNYHSN